MTVFETTNKIQSDINSMPVGTEKRFTEFCILVAKTAKGTTITISGEQHFAENANVLRPYIRTQVKSTLEDMNKKQRKKKQ
jgi:hypothetical protein